MSLILTDLVLSQRPDVQPAQASEHEHNPIELTAIRRATIQVRVSFSYFPFAKLKSGQPLPGTSAAGRASAPEHDGSAPPAQVVEWSAEVLYMEH